MTNKVFTRAPVELNVKKVAIKSLIAKHDKLAFRDPKAYNTGGDSVKNLAEDIRLTGLTTPLIVQEQPGGKNLIVEGHRRQAAIQKLVNDKVPGWRDDTEITVQVLAQDVSYLDLLFQAGSANIARENWDDLGIIRFAVALLKEGCPKAEIGRNIGKGEKQVDRYLLIGQDHWACEQLDKHYTGASQLATLLQAAKMHDCLDRFKTEFDDWATKVKLDIDKENRRRIDNDQKELTGDKAWVQKQLKSDQVTAWKTGMETGKWGDPVFKFKALIEHDKKTGRRTIEVDSINSDLGALSLADTTKIYSRCLNLSQELEPVLLQKQQLEATATKDGGGGTDAASRRLAELGLAAVEEETETDGDKDRDFDKPIETIETDVASTVELPGDNEDGEGDDK